MMGPGTPYATVFCGFAQQACSRAWRTGEPGGSVSSVDLDRLRVFAEVARQGSVTRAARRLRLQQPTVSHALAALEREVGAALLERLPKGVRLTAAGAALLPYARQMPGLAAEAV